MTRNDKLPVLLDNPPCHATIDEAWNQHSLRPSARQSSCEILGRRADNTAFLLSGKPVCLEPQPPFHATLRHQAESAE